MIGGLIVTFLIISAIYWAVPKGHMPWRSVWPGALFFSLVTSVGELHLSPLPHQRLRPPPDRRHDRVHPIALVWFYAISLALMAGAVINSLRHETDDTGALPMEG